MGSRIENQVILDGICVFFYYETGAMSRVAPHELASISRRHLERRKRISNALHLRSWQSHLQYHHIC